MSKKYAVDGLHCQGCVNILRAELLGIEGVRDISVSEDFKNLEVLGFGFTDDKIEQGVKEAGFEVLSVL